MKKIIIAFFLILVAFAPMSNITDVFSGSNSEVNNSSCGDFQSFFDGSLVSVSADPGEQGCVYWCDSAGNCYWVC